MWLLEPPPEDKRSRLHDWMVVCGIILLMFLAVAIGEWKHAA